MKKIVYITAIIVLGNLTAVVKAQDAAPKLNEATKAYAAKDLDGTRFALQEALVEINKAIGKEILSALPTKISDISYNEKEDNISGAAGFAGLFVNRTYGTPEGKNGKIDIMGDSPLLTAINAILAMPAIMGTSNPNEKRIKVGGYKSLLKKDVNTETNVVSYTLQIPINQTLVTLEVKGIAAENDVIAIANSLPIEKIAKVSQ